MLKGRNAHFSVTSKLPDTVSPCALDKPSDLGVNQQIFPTPSIYLLGIHRHVSRDIFQTYSTIPAESRWPGHLPFTGSCFLHFVPSDLGSYHSLSCQCCASTYSRSSAHGNPKPSACMYQSSISTLRQTFAFKPDPQ